MKFHVTGRYDDDRVADVSVEDNQIPWSRHSRIITHDGELSSLDIRVFE